MTRLVQIQNGTDRRLAVVEEPNLRILSTGISLYALAQAALMDNLPLTGMVHSWGTDELLRYDSVYEGLSDWKLLPPIDHPSEPSRCLVSGTGLTHLGGAKDRDGMHQGAEMTDSMKMYRLGVEGGRPPKGRIGAAPEWFFKGTGTILRGHNAPLVVPSFAEDGGEEGEIAGIYIINPEGHPVRLGMAIGNEFSDHKFEKKNYLNLAASKLRTCSLGPEIVIDPDFQSVPGKVSIYRQDQVLWSRDIRTGENEMCHNLANLEHHHFKHEPHRRPGDIHVHYFGACALSFGEGVALQNRDVMEIRFEGFGRPLRNPLHVDLTPDELRTVEVME